MSLSRIGEGPEGDDALREALESLDPAARALLDLSLGRGMPDWKIAELLGGEPLAITHRRGEGVDRVAARLGRDGPDEVAQVHTELRELLAAGHASAASGAGVGLRGSASATAGGAAGRPDASTTADRVADPTTGRPSRRLVIGAAIAVVAFGVLVSLALVGGGDGPDGPAGGEAMRDGSPERGGARDGQNAPTRGRTETPRGGRSGQRGRGRGAAAPLGMLQPLPGSGSDADGTARVARRGGDVILRMRMRDLPRTDGVYQVWLYNSQLDALAVASFKPKRGPNAPERTMIAPRLPPDFGRYRFVDVSIEPGDGNTNHSGESVLRVPLSELKAGG